MFIINVLNFVLVLHLTFCTNVDVFIGCAMCDKNLTTCQRSMHKTKGNKTLQPTKQGNIERRDKTEASRHFYFESQGSFTK